MNVLRALLVTVEDGEGWVGSWSPGIGDPTVFGWVVTGAYLVTVALCLRAAGRVAAPGVHGRPPRAREQGNRLRRAWRVLALAFAGLGLNKQLDLQTLPTEALRILSRRQGWYEQRRALQLLFVIVVLGVGLWGLHRLWRLARGPLRELRLALAGAILLICFIALRASSFHHVDWIFRQDWSGLRAGAVLELGGVLCVAAAAARQR